ncbi:hypothetical protein [Nitrospira sp. M1]
MQLILKVIILTFILTFWTITSYAEEEQSENGQEETEADNQNLQSTELSSNYFLTVDGRYNVSRWDPGWLDNILDFETKGLQTYGTRLALGYKTDQLLTLTYELPLNDTPDQQDLLNSNKTSNTGIKGLVLDIRLKTLSYLGGLAQTFLCSSDYQLFCEGKNDSEYTFSNFAVDLLSSSDLQLTKERFFGRAIAERPFQFIDRNASVSINQQGNITIPPGDVQNVETGESVRFSTTFKDLEYTIDLVDLANNIEARQNPNIPVQDFHLDGKGYSNYNLWTFKLGYYRSTWRRPSSVGQVFNLNNGLPVIFGSEFKTQGAVLTFGFRDHDYQSPGKIPWWRINIRSGISNKIRNAVRDVSDTLSKRESFTFTGLKLNLWYNVYPVNWLGPVFKKYTKLELPKGLFVKFGGLVDWRTWQIQKSPSFNFKVNMVDADLLLRGFVLVGIHLRCPTSICSS